MNLIILCNMHTPECTLAEENINGNKKEKRRNWPIKMTCLTLIHLPYFQTQKSPLPFSFKKNFKIFILQPSCIPTVIYILCYSLLHPLCMCTQLTFSWAALFLSFSTFLPSFTESLPHRSSLFFFFSDLPSHLLSWKPKTSQHLRFMYPFIYLANICWELFLITEQTFTVCSSCLSICHSGPTWPTGSFSLVSLECFVSSASSQSFLE